MKPYRSGPSAFIRLVESGIRDATDVSHSAVHIVKFNVLADHFLFGSREDCVEGIFVAINDPPAIGTMISLEVHMPWGESFVCDGEVMWLRQAADCTVRQRSGMGVRLVGATDDQLALLKFPAFVHGLEIIHPQELFATSR